MFAGEDPVRPRDRLHQRVIPHRLVEIDGRAARSVESGQPHRTDEDQPQVILRVLELLIQLLGVHPLPMGPDVEAEFLHLIDLVLTRRDDHRHVGLLEDLQTRFEFGLLFRGDLIATQLPFHPIDLLIPEAADLRVHPQGGCFVYRDHHRLPLESPSEEVVHDIPGHRLEAVITGDDLVLAAEFSFEFRLLLGIEFRLLDQIIDLIVQIGIHQLEFRCPILVEERHRRPILHRLLEVIDRDIVAEDLLRPLLPCDQRRPGEGQEERLRQGRTHVQRQRVVLAPMGLVGEHDHVGAIAEHIGHLELLDQGEDIAVIPP